jgi:hypothetical protein
LVENKAEVNLGAPDGTTPIMVATPPCLRYLLSEKADVSAVTDMGQTALTTNIGSHRSGHEVFHFDSEGRSHLEIIQLLINAKSNVNVRFPPSPLLSSTLDSNSETPQTMVGHHNHRMYAGLRSDYQIGRQHAPLMIACRNRRANVDTLGICHALLAAKATPHITGFGDDTLMQATLRGGGSWYTDPESNRLMLLQQVQLTKLWLSLGCDTNTSSSSSSSSSSSRRYAAGGVLCEAANIGNLEVCRMLLDAKCNVHGFNRRSSPAHLNNNINARHLMDPNGQTSDGSSSSGGSRDRRRMHAAISIQRVWRRYIWRQIR